MLSEDLSEIMDMRERVEEHGKPRRRKNQEEEILEGEEQTPITNRNGHRIEGQ